MITKDLGIATAYGYALSKGYTGTEEEFAELMASYASTAQTAVEAAERAVAAQGAAELAQGKAEDAQGVAEGKATEASGSADSASTNALKAEGLAVGQQNGTDVGSGSPYYHANAKYYKEQAAGSATTASNKAGEAAQSATDASNAKTAAQTAQGKAEDAQTAAETAQGKAEDAQEAAEAAAEQAEQTLNSYAHVDGYYEQMTVGNAEQLVSTVTVEDKVPYLFRTSGGSADIGNRENDMVVGGTIAWNQLVPTESRNFTNTTTESVLSVNLLFRLNASPYTSFYNKQTSASLANFAFIAKATATGKAQMIHNGQQTQQVFANNIDVVNGHAYIGMLNFTSNDITSVGGLVVKDIQLFDITQMFGSTIADYIYSLEQATPGAGVAYFRKLFPKPYYAYNPGELMSVQTSAHKLVGFNAAESFYVDKNANAFTKVLFAEADLLPNTTYCLSLVGVSGNKVYTNERLFNMVNVSVTGSRQYVLATTVGTLDKNDPTQYTESRGWCLLKNQNGNTVVPNFTEVCLNLSWDGERDGEYEPYTVHSYALDSDLVLRGIPKMDANNALFYDGDTYESDGTVTRRYGTITFDGTESWTKYETGGHTTFNRVVAGMKLYGYGIMGKKYSYDSATIINFQGEMTWISFGYATGTLISIKDDSYSDKETFAASMAGVSFVYELATPTTETADTYQNPQIVDDFGTEEYVDAAATAETNPRDVAIPVGHVTEYQNNLRAKLEMSPESPSGDGDYIVRQTNGQNAYVPVQFPADELPSVPTTDGNYRLKCTVSGGTATFSWEEIV